VTVVQKFTEDEMRAKLGNFKGVISSYDAVHEEYHIDVSADNTYELLSFDDMLTLLPNTWLFERAHANIACVQLALTTTIFDVAVLKYTGKPVAFVAIASGFIEPMVVQSARIACFRGIHGCAICQNCMFSGEFNTLSFFRSL